MKLVHRTLFLLAGVLTLLLILRIEYLRRCEAFHRQEARRFAGMICLQKNVTPVEVEAALKNAAENPRDFRLDHKFHQVFYHREAAVLYGQAVYHPWIVVHEPDLPKTQNDE